MPELLHIATFLKVRTTPRQSTEKSTHAKRRYNAVLITGISTVTDQHSLNKTPPKVPRVNEEGP